MVARRERVKHAWIPSEVTWMDSDGTTEKVRGFICRYCGQEVEESLPGVPNVNGSHRPEECDVASVRRIMES
jgi:hypothetical protein